MTIRVTTSRAGSFDTADRPGFTGPIRDIRATLGADTGPGTRRTSLAILHTSLAIRHMIGDGISEA